MEANQRQTRSRKPLSDCTNTSPSVSLKPYKTNPSFSSSSSSSSSALHKPPPKCGTSAPTNLDNAPNPTSPKSPPLPSTPSLKPPSLHVSPGIVDVEASEPVSEPISVFYSRRFTSKKRKKDKGKAVAVPVCSTPILKISDSREKNDEFQGAKLPKAKASTVPRRKKQRALSSENDAFKDSQLQAFIEERKAYFKEIDEFELPVEVESGDELD